MMSARALAQLPPFNLKKLIIAAGLKQSQSAVAGWNYFGLCNSVWCTG
jgi:hypothetical protein